MLACQTFYPLGSISSSQVKFNILDSLQKAIPDSAFYTHGIIAAKPEESDPPWVPQPGKSGASSPKPSRYFQISMLLRLLWARLVSSLWSDAAVCETAWRL